MFSLKYFYIHKNEFAKASSNTPVAFPEQLDQETYFEPCFRGFDWVTDPRVKINLMTGCELDHVVYVFLLWIVILDLVIVIFRIFCINSD